MKLCKDCKHCQDDYGSAYLVTGIVSEKATCARGRYMLGHREYFARCNEMRTHPLPEIKIFFVEEISIPICGPDAKLFEERP